ncbi:hypothetical protein [Nocardioides acrostichi]|uniref:Uncharacterized protein n=1 Tax=Nocardioides acrostichi TaxID=2784339 RepID=A0A930UXA6_9ACTN|nr:hypothetical protein [Nocardioides acrostichi]MBF4162588.1 hypothetical protein [Nocardioides acrostichi]
MTAATATAAAAVAEFNYSVLVSRTDSTFRPHDAPDHPLDIAGLSVGRAADVLACVLGVWKQFSLPADVVATMGGVLAGLLEQLTKAGFTVHTADEETLTRFATTNPAGHAAPTFEEVLLRHNVINGTYLALEDARMIEPAAPLTLPGSAYPTSAGRAHVRSATHDEVLLIRLASRMVQSQRRQYLATACVAICSSTATTAEAPQVLWHNCASDDLTLAGRTSLNDRAGMNIAARTVTMDHWATTALSAWKAERSALRPVHEDDSVLYTGTQALTSNSAAASTDQQVKKAIKLAGLAQAPGLTAGSLRLWSILKDATDLASAARAARQGGITLVALHTRVETLIANATK